MKKKIILAVTVIALVCAISAVGTIAYLTATSKDGEAIVNTFVASDGLIDKKVTGNGLFIEETDANDTLKKTTSGNSYTVLPNVPITKDATVKVVGKTDLKGYVFVEVVDTLDKELSWNFANGWLKLTGVTGASKDAGDVYVYETVLTSKTANSIQIIKDNKINVTGDYSADNGGSLNFYGYMCQQASFEPADNTQAEFLKAAAKAYKACFSSKPE